MQKIFALLFAVAILVAPGFAQTRNIGEVVTTVDSDTLSVSISSARLRSART